jgi:hypothetical protein
MTNTQLLCKIRSQERSANLPHPHLPTVGPGPTSSSSQEDNKAIKLSLALAPVRLAAPITDDHHNVITHYITASSTVSLEI